MKQTRFSQRLSLLMKERKISGQRIGDAIGKSQKTISRYANGEVDPDNDTKNAIYRVIADISGIEEDAMTEEELAEQELFDEWTDDLLVHPEYREWEMGAELQKEESYRLDNLEKKFDQLSLGAKQYYLKYMDKFHLIEEWEYEVMDVFHKLSTQKQVELVEYLEHFDFTYKKLRNTEKIASYMEMIGCAEKSPILIKENNVSEENKKRDLVLKKEWSERMLEICNREKYYVPYSPYFLSYSPYDWYFLLRVQIFEIYEDGNEYFWGDEHGGICIGNKLMHLLDSFTEGD